MRGKRSDRAWWRAASLARRGPGGLGALLLLAGCADVDVEAWLDRLGEHGHSGGGATCGEGRHAPLRPLGGEPAEGTRVIEPDGSVAIAFSGPLAPEGSAGATVTLLGAEGARVPGHVAVAACRVMFTPSERLVLGAAYTLRIEGSVRGRHGSAWAGSAEARFQTRDGTWSEPESVAFVGDRPQLSAGPRGTAVAAWQVPAGSVSASVALARYTPGEPWQPLPVSGTSGGPYSIPVRVVVGEDDSIELLWHHTGEVFGAVYSPGHGLGPSTSRDYQARTLDGDGAIAGGLTWLATSAIGGISLAHTSDGSIWSEWTLAPRDVEAEPQAAGPRLTTDEDGNVRAFWVTDADLYLSSVASGAAPTDWTAPEPIVSLDAEYGVSPIFASGLGFPFADAESELGHSLLAWQEDYRGAGAPPSGVASRLRVVQLAPDGSIDEARPEALEAPGNARSPALAMNVGGDALLSWVATEGAADDPPESSLWLASRRARDASWSTPLPLSPLQGVRVGAASLALDPTGNGHAVWVEVSPSGVGELRAARISREGSVTGASTISGAVTPAPVPPSARDNAPRVVVDASGRALAVWAAAGGGIWSARFE